jgi:glycosyltransferase involved in cell wall biosynthesis
MSRLRLVWLLSDPPIRGVSAAQERWWQLLGRLARRHEVTIFSLVDPAHVPSRDAFPPGLARVETMLRRPPSPADALALLPAHVRFAYAHPAYDAAVDALLETTAHDVLQVEYQEMMNLVPARWRPTILTVHQIGFAADRATWRASGRRVRPWDLYRHLRSLDWELRTIARARHVVTMSPEDAARLRRFVPGVRTSVSPVGVDTATIRPPDAPAEPTADVFFLGNFHHPPNVDAVRWLATGIVPALGRSVTVDVAGREMPDDLARFLEAHGLRVVGPLDDFRPHVAAARVVVAPVRFGTGMRGKVLEALAMARPLVTTSLGAEGLGATPGEHLVVADDTAAFAAAIRALLDDPGRAARIGAAGRSLVERRFDWDPIAGGHDEIYARALAEPDAALGVPPDRSARLAAVARRVPPPWNGVLGAALLARRGASWYLRGGR